MKVAQSRAQHFNNKRLEMTKCVLEIYNGYSLLCSVIISLESLMLPPIAFKLLLIHTTCTHTLSHKHTQATFILKKVMLVSRSTVDFRSWRRSGFPAGKLSWSKSKREEKNMRRQGVLLKAPPTHHITLPSRKD